jgi:PBSX family phage portal protein|tara:strand:+ start:1138 stop:2796 length:1659 start_codon:yes stop_codon:yes gene_type:complete
MNETSFIEEDGADVEIDDISYTQVTSQFINTDPFKKIDLSKQSAKVKRRYQRLQKAAPSKPNKGVGEAKSRYVDPDSIDGYALYDVIEPPHDLNILADLYETNTTHFASINARVANTVALGFAFEDSDKTKRRVEKANTAPKKEKIRIELARERKKLYALLDDSNIEDTFSETMIKLWTDYLTIGNAYLEIGRTNIGKIGYIGHIPAINMRVRRQRDGFVQIARHSKIQSVFFRNFQDLETSDPINSDGRPNEIIHFKAYTPTSNYYGVPSAVTAIGAILGDKYAKNYNIDYFENKAIPRYAIILKGAKLSNKSKQELVNYFRTEVKGRNHGTLIVPLPASLGNDVDIKFEKLEANVQDASFDKYRKSNRDEILVANRVPAPKVGVYDNANLAVARDADKTFKVQVVGPDQKVIEKRINYIVKEFTDLVDFRFEQIDLIDEDVQSKIRDRYLRTEVFTPNEVRSMLGLPDREAGEDELPYPSNIRRMELLMQTGVNPFTGEDMVEEEPERPEGAPEGNDNADTPPAGDDSANPEASNERGTAQDSDGVREKD